ncbi:MAG: RNA 2',3'-cyclic phosphodiesterase [Gemmatimonadota bacterium]|jgi:RNA 2',3'-cyclic 3'-phosphodiesterase
MRLFIALNLPAKERERIYKAAAPIRESELPVGWIEPDRFHLTLKFLGEVRPEMVPAVEEVLDRVADGTRPFPLKIEGFGAFPTIRRPKVLWIGVEASPALRCLKQDLEWALTERGFDRETRAFHPHITLGRADAEVGAGAFRGLDSLAASLKFRGELEVERLDLMRSHLSREGARYTVVRTSDLKVAAPRK